MTVPQVAANRAAAVAGRWSLAVKHPDEAKATGAMGQAPISTIHSAYYAMHHAARAVLVSRATGADVVGPRSHGAVVQEFGRLVKGGPADVLQARRGLNQLMDERTAADYGVTFVANPADALAAVGRAIAFLDVCRAAFGMSP